MMTKRFFVYLCITIFAVFFAVFLSRCIVGVYAATVEDNYHDANTKIFSGVCYGEENEKDFTDINPAIIGLLCYIREGFYADDSIIIFHSGHRPNGSSTSQHKIGNAIDFRFSSYQDFSYCNKMERYHYDYTVLFDAIELFKSYIGLGIYPDSLNPFFHLDFGGGWRSWSRLNGEYLSLQSGIDYIQDQLNICSQ